MWQDRPKIPTRAMQVSKRRLLRSTNMEGLIMEDKPELLIRIETDEYIYEEYVEA